MNPFKLIGVIIARVREIGTLRDGIKQKISEAHLQIRSGECTEEQLNAATETLNLMREKASKVKLL